MHQTIRKWIPKKILMEWIPYGVLMEKRTLLKCYRIYYNIVEHLRRESIP